MSFVFIAINIYELSKGGNIGHPHVFGFDLEAIIADLLKGSISIKSR